MSAVISADQKYRYLLGREWIFSSDQVFTATACVFVMLNPSTADAELNDRTITRCIGYATRWGYGILQVVNLFAYRATDPDELVTAIDPVGPDNRIYLEDTIINGGLVVAAWGAHHMAKRQAFEYRDILTARPMVALGYNKDNSPKHPLYVRGDVEPIEWTP